MALYSLRPSVRWCSESTSIVLPGYPSPSGSGDGTDGPSTSSREIDRSTADVDEVASPAASISVRGPVEGAAEQSPEPKEEWYPDSTMEVISEHHLNEDRGEES